MRFLVVDDLVEADRQVFVAHVRDALPGVDRDDRLVPFVLAGKRIEALGTVAGKVENHGVARNRFGYELVERVEDAVRESPGLREEF